MKHLTPRYVVDRTAVTVWQRRHPGRPWLTAVAVMVLGEWLTDKDTVLEWGSGRSTVWFGRHAARVVSVEHDATWFETVGETVRSADLTNVERHLQEATDAAFDPPAAQYVGVVDRLEDSSVDLVLVDGLHRDRCAVTAIPKVRPGGRLVLDNADWYMATGTRTPASKRKEKLRSEWWAQFDALVADWRRIVTTNGVWDTAIWIKPAMGRE